ncbi:MAG: thiamine phosphate synthase [Planctomycetota bacterium]|nr:thiamine phosphate synthase [Planctomycetota bacterium]
MTSNSDAHAAFRIIDANANRSLEGLRVVEDFTRFCLNDKHLATQYKGLRHELAAVLAQMPQLALMAARNTPGDVGTKIEADDEYTRDSGLSVALASQKRVEQALRCIEEYVKTVVPEVTSPEVASSVEQLRYRVYTLGKAIALTAASRVHLDDKRLYVLIDGGRSPEAFERLARQLTESGVDFLQLRDKRLCDRELVSRGRVLREITQGSNTLFIVNDRPDVAAITRADGVHVGQEELSVADVRAVLGPHRLVGVSTHSIEQARQAVLDGADYIGCGPTFPSPTKEFNEFPGLTLLQAVADEISLPAFAIGGITLENLSQIVDAGFRRIAVGCCVTSSNDPRATVKHLQAAFPSATLTTSSTP